MNSRISLNITNNTTGNIPLSLLGNDANLADNSNASTRYLYDVSGVSFTTLNTVSVEYKPTLQTFYSTFVASFSGGNLSGVLNALNTLGIGEFYSFTSGPSTFIANNDNNYAFGVLICYVGSNPQCSYQYNVTATAISDSAIKINTIQTVTFINPTSVSGHLNNPSATPIGGGLVNGDSVEFLGTSPTAVVTLTYNIKNETTGAILFSGTITSSNTPFSFTFVVSTGNSYSIEMYQV